MAAGAQVNVAVRSGAAEQTSCVVVIHSRSNVAGNLQINGTDYAIASGNWAQIGTDGPVAQACFKAQKTIVLPAVFAKYPFAITQGSDITIGTLRNKPGVNDSFSIFHIGCDSHKNSPTGFYKQIKYYATDKDKNGYPTSGNLPVACLLKNGDLGYVDDLYVNDAAGTSVQTSTGATTGYPQATNKTYDYAVAYMCGLGMFGDTSKTNIAWGRDEDRIWCEQNLNSVPQWDDHEFAQDHTGTSGVYAKAKAAWDAFYGPLQPTVSIKSADLVSNHWGYTIGGICIVAMDEITSAVGTWSAPAYTMTGIYGVGQITDALNALNTSDPFKLLLTNNSTRYLEATVTEYNAGAQHPVFNSCLAEYQMLFTADSMSQPAPLSIMANPKTNGLSGVLANINSDLHQQLAQVNKAPAYTNNLVEYFWHIANGSTNGSANHGLSAALLAAINAAEAAGKKYTYAGTTIDWIAKWVASSGRYGGTRIDYYGSLPQKEMHIVLMDENGNEVWHGRWIERSSNEVVPIDWQTPQFSAGGNL